jgi:hypothetical protein
MTALKIISKRFGLDGGKPKTLEDVSKDFGVTRERIRQLQNIALAKLRRAFSKRENLVGRSAGSRQTDLYVSGRGYYDAIDLAVGPAVLLRRAPQKWQAHFPHPQQKKIPRVRSGRHRIPAKGEL